MSMGVFKVMMDMYISY